MGDLRRKKCKECRQTIKGYGCSITYYECCKVDEMRGYWIIGYIDYLDVVHSKKINWEEHGQATHEELFGLKSRNTAWCLRKGLDRSVYAEPFSREQWDKVYNHLLREYGLTKRIIRMI